MQALKIIAVFLACRLVWTWLDLCGADLGVGEALPFCHNCNGFATTVRLLFLGLGGFVIFRTLQEAPNVELIPEDDPTPGQSYIIRWDNIAILIAVVGYPLWVWWLDQNTTVPGPQDMILFDLLCRYAGFKGTLIWGVIVTFLVMSFRILYRK